MIAALLVAMAGSGCTDERPVDLPSEAGQSGPRVAVMAPSAAEMIGALAAIDAVVAVGDFVEWPIELRELPKIGAYDAPNEELLLSLAVDTLITSRSSAAASRLDRLDKLGIQTLALDLGTYDGVFESLTTLGRFFGEEERAADLEQEIRSRLAAIRERTATAPPRRVLIVVGRDPLYVAGPGSFIDEVVGMAGGENVAADAGNAYQLVSLEVMLERLPEVVIEVAGSGPNALRGRQAGYWGQWPFLPAVANDRVYWVDPTRLVVPGPRLPEMAELAGKLIHPEIFGEPSAANFQALHATAQGRATPSEGGP